VVTNFSFLTTNLFNQAQAKDKTNRIKAYQYLKNNEVLITKIKDYCDNYDDMHGNESVKNIIVDHIKIIWETHTATLANMDESTRFMIQREKERLIEIAKSNYRAQDSDFSIL